MLGDADTAGWIARRFGEAPGLNARVVGRVPLEPELVSRERDPGARRRLGAAITARWSGGSTGR